jgi:hypothetical protein
MINYAKLIAGLKVVKELRNSADRDDIPSTEVDKLVATVNTVADRTGPLLERIPQTFKQYTEHNFGHCRNLIDLMGRFIPRETLKKMNGLELAVLITSALLHDFGMFVSEKEKKETLTSEEFSAFLSGHADRAAALEEARDKGELDRAEVIQDTLLAEYFRRLHPERVRQNVRDNLPGVLVYGDVDITEYVLEVCESHVWGVYESNDPKYPHNRVSKISTNKSVYGIPLNLQYLACCLRLADIMDFDRSRTPLVVFQNIDFTEEKSWEEWNKHLSIKGWVINERDVTFRAECKHPAFYVAVMDFLDWVDHELTECSRLINKESPHDIALRYKLHLPLAVDRSKVEMEDKSYLAGAFRFQLEYERIMGLLMDKSLYPDSNLFLRELLQNSLDACRNREAHAKELGQESLYNPRIAVWDHSDDSENPRIVFQDNGTGMSRKIVENYFMRVGRSYYRSPEFDAERARLKKGGIELEAASQFGIGILSCFMVADRLEVETYRTGHTPLNITIEGPTKYFIIKILNEPPRTDFPIKLASDDEDGPPYFPGTRITIHIRPGSKVDVFQTLSTFAANIDYTMTLYGPGIDERTIISPLQWEEKGVEFNRLEGAIEAGYHNAWPVAGLKPRIVTSNCTKISENLQEILTYSRIPFEKYEFSTHLKGSAWFWLLKGEDGHACPQRGYLNISRNFHLTGLPKVLQHLTENVGVDLDSDEWKGFLETLREMALRGQIPEQKTEADRQILSAFGFNQRGADAYVKAREFIGFWERLPSPEQEAAVESLESLRSDAELWYDAQGILHELLLGTHNWISRSIRFDYPLRINPKPQSLSLHGILLPAGFVKWDPMTGQSNSLKLLEFIPAGILLDMRGSGAPTPTASRLSVLFDEAKKSALPFMRACLYHALELAFSTPEDLGWYEWFDGFVDSFKDLQFWPEIINQEYDLLESQVKYAVVVQGKLEFWGRDRIINLFGRWVPFYDERFNDEGLYAYNGATLLMSSFKARRQRHENVWEADFESKHEFVGNKLQDIYLPLQQEVLYR